MQNRDMNDLRQIFRTPLEKWLADVIAWGTGKGIRPFVYETHRTARRQAQLYSWGRTVRNPNTPAGIKGLGACVTYTLDSAHEYGVACDWVPLILKKGTWNQDWSHSTYEAVYRAVPPAKYGLEILPWEKPHLQLKGVNGMNQTTPASVWAAANGCRANDVVRSVWPLPAAPTIVKPAPVKVVTAQYVRPPRVFARDTSGKNAVLTEPTTYGGEVVGQLPDGRLTIGGVIVGLYPDHAIQLDRMK
ncbi:hypothetical protein ACINK0_11390 [Deinococcus sp. VB343]|uniref:hypothetical protein n=1 Tax=Deinococcus sp. VB343 TaxID=3385567 RepID=UPI0039C976F2